MRKLFGKPKLPLRRQPLFTPRKRRKRWQLRPHMQRKRLKHWLRKQRTARKRPRHLLQRRTRGVKKKRLFLQRLTHDVKRRRLLKPKRCARERWSVEVCMAQGK